MNTGIKIFTVLFTLMCIENTFRIADFIAEWSHPIDEATTAHSDYSIEKLVNRQKAGPGAIVQIVTSMCLMAVNNVIWVRRKVFCAGWHIFHYFTASIVMLMYLPWLDSMPFMTSAKYFYSVINIVVF